jgi:hypothetical protein
MGVNLVAVDDAEEVSSHESLGVGKGRAVVVVEVVGQRVPLELLAEEVHLVEEEDQGGPEEPTRIGDRLPERQALLHPADVLVLVEPLIVFGNRGDKDEGLDVFEAALVRRRKDSSQGKQTRTEEEMDALDPLFALGSADDSELAHDQPNAFAG